MAERFIEMNFKPYDGRGALVVSLGRNFAIVNLGVHPPPQRVR